MDDAAAVDRRRRSRARCRASTRTSRPRRSTATRAGVQRDIGWQTVRRRWPTSDRRPTHLLQTINLNMVPYGARFDPANQDPTRPGNPLPDNFFRPYPGYGDINYFLNNGIAELQRAAGAGQPALHARPAVRRRLHALAVARLHLGDRDRHDARAVCRPTADVRDWTYGLSSFDQTHVAVINYTCGSAEGRARSGTTRSCARCSTTGRYRASRRSRAARRPG